MKIVKIRIIRITLTRLHTSWRNDQRSQPPTRHHPVLHQTDDRKGEKHGWRKSYANEKLKLWRSPTQHHLVLHKADDLKGDNR